MGCVEVRRLFTNNAFNFEFPWNDMQHAAAPFRSASKNARSFVKPQISAVHLYSLPRSIIPRDIRRLAEKVGIVGAYEGEPSEHDL